jgi:hypothetical protein
MSSPATSATTIEQKVISFFEAAFQDVGAFLTKVSQGAEVAIEDIESIAAYVDAHLGVINASISTLAATATAVAPNNATVQKMITDLQTATNDVAAVSTSLSSGSTAGQPTAVTTAVSAIKAVQQLAGLAGQAGSAISDIVAASPTATQAVSQPTPNEG